jgi:malonyl-CoA O-methyltransferase
MTAVPPSAPLEPAVPDLDPVAAAHWRAREPVQSPWLHDTVGLRMAERLDWIRTQPAAWVHWAPLLGGEASHRAVVQRYPAAQVWLAGEGAAAAQARWGAPVRPWWQRWRRMPTPLLGAGAIQGVLADQGAPPPTPIGLVWANMVLHTVAQPRALLRRWLDCLAVGGFLMFSCLGPDSLRELRALHQRLGWPPPAPPYVDMHDWGDLLVETGYAEPVMDMEYLTLTYPSAQRLLEDLRATGRNWHAQRFAALRGRGWRERWLQAVEAFLPRDAQGHLRLTVEIIYGHAVRGQPRRSASAETVVPMAQLRAQLRAEVRAAASPPAGAPNAG